MTGPRHARRLVGVVLLAVVVALWTAPSEASTPVTPPVRVMPGSFTGYAFDTCLAPSQEDMDVWRESSPFAGVGIYIGGSMAYCQPDKNPNLTPEWVSRQTEQGWFLLPIWLGPQASCSTVTRYTDRIDATPDASYAGARAQGRDEARHAIAAAGRLGVAAGSTLWYDIEHYDVTVQDCRVSAVSFLSAWTNTLHRLGYRSGVYSSASSGIAALDRADADTPGWYAMPDQVWVGWGNGRADTYVDPAWVRPTSWAPHQRIHQYRLGVHATYGGVPLYVDRDFVDVGGGSVAPPPRAHCRVRVDFPAYRVQRLGHRGPQVAAAQCFLRQKGFYAGEVTGRFARSTFRAVNRFQRAHHLRASGVVTRRTWTEMLSEGPGPLVKYGSASNAVRRLQRSLNAAAAEGLTISGVFEASTAAAVDRYQEGHGLHATGVVTSQVWALLRSGSF